MSDYNCNALRNIAISDSLTQKLLSIPSTAKRQKKPVVIPLRCVMAAASMVLVFTLSISAIFLFRNKTNPVVPSPAVKETVAAKGNENTDASVSPTEESGTSSTQNPTQPSTQAPTQISTDSEGNIVIITITDIITEYGTEPAETDTPADSGTKNAQPTSQQTEQATDSQELHTDPPYYPTPTELAWDVIQNVYLDIPAERVEGVEKIYCAIFDEKGNLFGDYDLFSSSRLAERKGDSDGYIRIVYNPYENGIEIKTLYYFIYLYDENGNILNY
ncbi:MAG: hypothetical protein IJJ15_04770 [Ruminococcus sp.]|nr:hypothetical protein [Ruminococcus sp.]